tara:strand:+ start:48 stop:311 length:264 start_codon:yes stop_codon:yes gene_type:complete
MPYSKQYPYVLEVRNDVRKYVLAATSYFDVRAWFDAILMQIESQKNNQLIDKVRCKIVETEKNIAKVDLMELHRVNRMDFILFNLLP